jgi:transposase
MSPNTVTHVSSPYTILWEEYVEQHPDGYRYSRFCELYRGWEGKLSVTMRQTPRWRR